MTKEGWQRPPWAETYHYYLDERSLCGRAKFGGKEFEGPDFDATGEDVCKTCARAHKARRTRVLGKLKMRISEHFKEEAKLAQDMVDSNLSEDEFKDLIAFMVEETKSLSEEFPAFRKAKNFVWGRLGLPVDEGR